MTIRPAAAVRVLIAGTVLIAALAAVRGSGAIGATAYQSALTALFVLAAGLILARGVVRALRRRGWLALGAAILTGMLGNSTYGWALVGVHVPDVVAVLLSVASLLLGFTGLLLLLADRPSRLPLAAGLDGMTGAVVVQAVIGLFLLGPIDGAIVHEDALSLVALMMYPLVDVLLMGFVAAAVAHGGWRVDCWAVCLAGLVAITIGDSSELASSVAGGHQAGGIADFGWLAGAWLIAVGAWSPEPVHAPERWVRSAVPVVFGAAALALLLVTALSSRLLALAMGLAAVALAVVIARLAITLRENAGMLTIAETEATTDALTGLANRRQLVSDLEKELRDARVDAPSALALFDLNGFKDYNDTYGHQAGDALLAALGTELSAAVEGLGTAYRMGGDEFCVLISPTASGHHAIVERAAVALSAGTRGFSVTAAHGVVLLPAEASNSSDALRRADLRMYEHKAGGRVGSRRQVTQALMLAIQERDSSLHGHGKDVQELAIAVARQLGLGDSEADAVGLGALLHDVGKLAIPDHILEKPGPLDDLEWEFMRRHTVIGQRILEGAPALRDIAKLVRSSHERFDGSGYPDGLAGRDIPAGSRIIAVCDAFDAMTSARAYRRAMSISAAVAELQRAAGTHFDPDAVSAFVLALQARGDARDEPLAA